MPLSGEKNPQVMEVFSFFKKKVCVYFLCAHVCRSNCTCVFMCLGQRLMLDVFLYWALPRASLLIGLSGQQALESVFLCAADPMLGFQMCKPGLAFTWVLRTQTQVPMLA